MNGSIVRLTFGIHNHQPVGNFAGVMDESYARCYSPFLDMLDKHPKIRIGLHHSGCLLEWIENNRPDYIERLGKLVERGQIEILGGGFYEPILPSIPMDDALEQLVRMNRWAKERLGADISGIWLTERIWEPSLPSLLAQAGIRYTIVDESHFRYAGIAKEKMIGYYSTERWGNTTSMFPIDKVLRYKIPFDSPENNLAYLRQIAKRVLNPVVTYADDGEKFGVWPETYEWVYEKGWLEKFFQSIEKADDVTMILFRDVLVSDPPMGRLYLPTASYHEMTEWALPVDSGIELANLRQHAMLDGSWEHLAPFVRGGFWDNFLAKYPEANRMHKRMLRVSQKTKDALAKEPDNKELQEARSAALRGQCNCAYWHGLFGGLYLNYLRDGVYSELYRAEKSADKVLGLPQFEITDYDADGNPEIVIETKHLDLVLKPSYGGSIFELVDRATGHQLTDVLARRREIYHDKLTSAEKTTGDPKNPHEAIRIKEDGLDKLLFYDWFNRFSSLDHFLAPWTDAASFAICRYGELGDFVNQPFDVIKTEQTANEIIVEMERLGGMYPGGSKHPLIVKKIVTVSLADPKMTLETHVTNKGAPISVWLARQWNLTLLAGNAPDRWIEIGKEKRMMGESGIADNMTDLTLNDGWKKIRVEMAVGEPVEFWHFPVETVSQSEGGFERTYQGTALVFSDKFYLETDKTKKLKLDITLGRLS